MKKNSSSFFWQLARYPITTIFSGWQYVAALRQNGRSHYEYSTHKHSPLHRVRTKHGSCLDNLGKLRKPSKHEVKAAWCRNSTILLPLKFYVKSNIGKIRISKNAILTV